MIYIIGHAKPDLDSAVAAVSLKYLFDNVNCYERKKAKAVLADPPNYETQTIFAKFNTPVPEVLIEKQIKLEDRFVLVDHNEISQRLAGISDDQITDIFDHHKVSLNLTTPIFITIKPWGSTNTLIWWLMKISNLKPTKNLASLMISAILSDTVALKSSVTTSTDKKALKQLNEIAQIKDIDALIREIFKAKSNITGLNNKQILARDYKLYDFTGKKILISQLETIEQEKLISQSKGLIKELEQLKKKMKLDRAFLIITDVLKINSKCFVAPEDEQILTKAFSGAKKLKNGVYDLGPVMSRKKEIVPAIEKAVG